jgi:hypothetical protein
LKRSSIAGKNPRLNLAVAASALVVRREVRGGREVASATSCTVHIDCVGADIVTAPVAR